MPVGLKRHLDRRRTHDASVISRELLERVDHGTKEVNDALVRLVARSVADNIKRLSQNSLRVGDQRLRNTRIHRSVRRVLAQLRLDLIL